MKTNDVNKKVDRTTIITILTIYYALYQYPLSIILAKVGVTACRAVIILDKNINNFGHSCISPWQYNHVIQRS